MSSMAAIFVSQMLASAPIVVVGHVTAAKVDGYSQDVTIHPVQSLRGEAVKKNFQLSLSVGGMKNTEPTLREGNLCVAFLRKNEKGVLVLATDGAISCFADNSPIVPDR
jgi:hypothetical protein